jgi:hypothetical protein
MKTCQLVFLVVFVVGAFAPATSDDDPPPPPGGDHHKKHHENHKKHIECAIETKNLTACCPMPKYEELKNDAECKSHLEGVDGKNEWKQAKAGMCFTECIFKSKGLIEGNDVKWDKLKEFAEQNADADTKDITAKAVDFCEAKGEVVEFSDYHLCLHDLTQNSDKELKEKFKNHKDGHHKGHHG